MRQIVGNSLTVRNLREAARCAKLIEAYSDQQVSEALAIVMGTESMDEHEAIAEDDAHTAFRRREFEALLKKRRDDQLSVTPISLDRYDDGSSKYFSSISLVERLRETRVLRGFSRVFPENDMDNSSLQALLRAFPSDEGGRWLPACVVFGEGIFIRFNEDALQKWEKQKDVLNRVGPLVNRYKLIQERRHLRDRPINPRFILVHTLVHLLINRLTFESGYSAASLRERLFISQHDQHPMGGLLIYTAAGDSEGTMGGLVRLGKPGAFEPLLRKAIEEARWCGADPVCMETGDMGGQGPDSCNIAACHNCSLIPETACEEFNRFLDRGLVVGTLANSEVAHA
jgi:MrfA Zn-binding domain